MSDLIERLRHPYPEIAGLAADEAADRIEALIAENERLREALEAARSVLMNSDAESGYCMCGDPVAGHSIGSGHSPVDSYSYMADAGVNQIDAALAAIAPSDDVADSNEIQGDN